MFVNLVAYVYTYNHAQELQFNKSFKNKIKEPCI